MAQLKHTAVLTNGSATVTIAGEDLSASVLPNHLFMVEGEIGSVYFVASAPTYSSINDETTVTLTGNYAGTSGTKTGVFVIDFTTPDQIPLIYPGDVGTASIFTQAMAVIQGILNRQRNYQSLTVTLANTTLDLDQSFNFHLTLQANTTLAIVNPPATAAQKVDIRIFLKQDATGGRVVTFPASVRWDNGTLPTWVTTANKTEVVHLFTIDGGATWYGRREFTNLT